MRLLVADDDPVLLEVMCEGLEGEGFEVVAAADGTQALELFRQAGPFDAVLADEEMPGLTGRKLLARIRQDRSTVPALLVSGNLEMDAEEQAALGAELLRKPVSLQDLVTAVRNAIGKDGLSRP